MYDNIESKIDRLTENGYSFSISDYISRGFTLYKASANIVLPFSLIYVFTTILLSRTWALSGIVSIFVSPCVFAGFYIVANMVMQGQTANFKDCFNGFMRFSDVVVVNLMVNLLSSLGLICLILPGIYLMVAYTFAIMFVIFLNTDFRTAMRLSRKVIHCNWWQMFGLIIVASLIGFSGTLLCGVGMAFTLPIMHYILYVAFEDIVGKAIRE